ncbi:MAG: hypothetical protein IPN30_12625 [Flavobacteriales bacterium]|nr:hypothetical protein [Flavobacteriales bacterium]
MKHFLHLINPTRIISLCLMAVGCLLTQVSVAQVSSTFSNSGSFTVPAGVTEVTVECWGGGGRGGRQTSNGRGGGGGGGAYSRSTIQ